MALSPAGEIHAGAVVQKSIFPQVVFQTIHAMTGLIQAMQIISACCH